MIVHFTRKDTLKTAAFNATKIVTYNEDDPTAVVPGTMIVLEGGIVRPVVEGYALVDERVRCALRG